MNFRSRYISVMLLLSVAALTDVFASDMKKIEGGKFVPQYGVGSSSEKITIKPLSLVTRLAPCMSASVKG